MTDQQLVPLNFTAPHRNNVPWDADRIAEELPDVEEQWASKFGVDGFWTLYHMPAGWMGAHEDPDDDPGDKMTGSQWWPLSFEQQRAYRHVAENMKAAKWGVYAGISGTTPYVTDVTGETPAEQYADSMAYPQDVPCFLATMLPWRDLGASLWIFDHANATDEIWAGAERLCYVAAQHGVYCGIETHRWRPINEPQYSRVWTCATNRLFWKTWGHDLDQWPVAPGGCPAYVACKRSDDPGWAPNTKDVRMRLLRLLTLGWCIGGDARYIADCEWAIETFSDDA